MNDIPINIRVALANNCTSGYNPNYCDDGEPRDNKDFIKLLREHSNIYARSPFVKYAFPEKDGVEAHIQNASLYFNWDAQNMKDSNHYESPMSADSRLVY